MTGSKGLSSFQSAVIWLIRVMSAGGVVTAGLIFAIFLTEFLPVMQARSNLVASFAEGALQDHDWLLGNRSLGVNQFNDCLLVQMKRFATSPSGSTIAPVIVSNQEPSRLTDATGTMLDECKIAHMAVASDTPRSLFPAERYSGYSRYVHGYRLPFNILISITTVSKIRIFYRGLAVICIVLIFLAHLWQFQRFAQAGNRAAATSALGFACVAASLLLFSGVDVFSQSLTHGPSDILLFASFGWLSLARRSHVRPTDTLIAALGALSFSFDFLHGTIPMMLAIIIGVHALRAFAEGESITLESVARLGAAFVLGVVGAVLVKLLAVMAFDGWSGVLSFFHQLLLRVNGGSHSYREVIASLAKAIPNMSWGHSKLGIFAIFGAAVALFLGLVLLSSGRIARRHRNAVVTGLLSSSVILVWYLVFKNHTAIHGIFMIRMIAWPIGMAVATLLIAISCVLEAQERRVPVSAGR